VFAQVAVARSLGLLQEFVPDRVATDLELVVGLAGAPCRLHGLGGSSPEPRWTSVARSTCSEIGDRSNKWNGISDAFSNEIVGVMQGSISPQAALAYVQANQGVPAA
jgi:hypothetical protein